MHNGGMTHDVDIKKLRKIRNWTQEEMGNHFGVDKSTVWRWENEGVPDRGVTRKAIEREWEDAQKGPSKAKQSEAAV